MTDFGISPGIYPAIGYQELWTGASQSDSNLLMLQTVVKEVINPEYKKLIEESKKVNIDLYDQLNTHFSEYSWENPD